MATTLTPDQIRELRQLLAASDPRIVQRRADGMFCLLDKALSWVIDQDPELPRVARTAYVALTNSVVDLLATAAARR